MIYLFYAFLFYFFSLLFQLKHSKFGARGVCVYIFIDQFNRRSQETLRLSFSPAISLWPRNQAKIDEQNGGIIFGEIKLGVSGSFDCFE